MNLSAEQYNDIIRSVHATEKPGKERRADARVGFSARVKIIVHTDNGVVNRFAQVRDLSRGGIGIVTMEPMAKGQFFVACLPSDAGGVKLLYRAVRCWQQNERFVIGAELVREYASN